MAVRADVENDQIVSDLRDALRDGRSGLSYVPRLLGLVLEREAWRQRVDEHGETYSFATFDEFVRAAPLAGLGGDPSLIDRIVGTRDPDLLKKLRAARKVGRGKRSDPSSPGVESTPGQKGEDSALTAQRLEAAAPAEYEAIRRGEKTINAAAVAAGIRPHRISVRLDRPDSVARSLRKHMSPDQLAELARLLTDGTEAA